MKEFSLPEISVIAAVYNTSAYLERFIKSVLSQTFSNFEFILVDDCSTDNSGKICEEYSTADSRIKVVHNEKNSGLATTRNVGLKNAVGKYFYFADSDDWLEKNCLEMFYTEAQKTKADVVGCDIFDEWSDSTFVRKIPLPESPEECIKGLLLGNIMGYLHIKFFNSALFKNPECKWIDGINVCEDILICTKLFYYAKKIAYLNQPLYHYNRGNNSSLTYNLDKNKAGQIIAADKLIEEFLLKKYPAKQFETEIKVRKGSSKIWILMRSQLQDIEYYKLHNGEKLFKCRSLSKKSRLMLFLCEKKMFFFARLFRKFL